MKKLWLSPTLAAVIGAALLYGEPAAAQVQTVSVTGGQVPGVNADGGVTAFQRRSPNGGAANRTPALERELGLASEPNFIPEKS
jgi:hypothetical protein